jgi:hypothetical protein
VVTDITFFKTGHKYDSYTDFFRLVELAGFPIIQIADLDVSRPGVFIGAPHNGEWEHIDRQAGRQRNAHIILWNIERPSGSAGAVGKYGARGRELMYQRQVDEVWVSDRRLADEASLRYVVLGSHPDLGVPGGLNEKKYEMVHMSAENPRRVHIYKHFPKNEVGPNGWGEERDATLRASKFALNVHQDLHPFCEPLRFALFAAYGLPILTETVFDAYPYGEGSMEFAAYDGLVPKLRQMIGNDYDYWRKMGMACRGLMTETFEFGKMVRLAVSQSVGDWR